MIGFLINFPLFILWLVLASMSPTPESFYPAMAISGGFSIFFLIWALLDGDMG